MGRKSNRPRAMERGFYDRDALVVAQETLGKLLVRESAEGTTTGRIVEVEAYLSQGDVANHAHRGKTRRNASMFGPPGRAYVYSIHARYCLNAVTEAEGTASAVLIRAVEPIEGIELMQERRRTLILRDLARGPARLCEAFGIDRSLDGWDLTRGQSLWLADGQADGRPPERIVATPRIGISSGQDLLLRLCDADSSFVSGPRRLPAAGPGRSRPGGTPPHSGICLGTGMSPSSISARRRRGRATVRPARDEGC